jgi:hypothetical protein
VPRYFFDVKNGHRLVDPAGVDCASDVEAMRHAEIIAKKIAVDVPKSIARRVAVIDNEGREVGTVRIGESNGKE